MTTLMIGVIVGIVALSGIILVIRKTKEMETKENIKKMKEMETKQNIKKMKETKGFSEIENIARSLVDIQEIQIDSENISTAYLLKVAGADIRLYFNFTDAYRVGIFMKGIIREVITSGYAKIDVKELSSDNDTYYLLQIANKNVKIYTSETEATTVAKYMTNVMKTILENI